ncbi:MAG: hypothetical protein QOE79_2569 [Sphingomonadales bacterium]|jgi:hypothetical protein|nr:hypothetical protein [Sphingomonadales bacterium]MEA3050000.1 hypothetical protein [Sphingomonadales bacterium]
MTNEKVTDGTFDRAVDDFDRQRQEVLATLIEELGDAVLDPEGAEFGRIMRHAQKLLNKTDVEMSLLFKVSRPTIGRWTRNVTAPHPLLRRAAFDTLLVEAKRALRSVRQRVDC